MRIAKTNLGTKVFKQEDHINSGSPNLYNHNETLGSIIDIRFPKQNADDKGSGVQVRVAFDTFDLLSEKAWVTLENEYSQILSSIGNRDAVLALRPRVIFKYQPINPTKGTAKLICDNTQERSFDYYQNNKSNNIVGIFSCMANNFKPPGF
jgi:hypothetical protein